MSPASRIPGWLSPHRLTGMAAPMLLWALHFVLVYSLQGISCVEGWQHLRLGGLAAVTWWLLGLTLAILLAQVALGMRALRAWRTARRARSLDAREAGDAPRHGHACAPAARHRRFTAAATAALALLAVVATCFTAIPILLLPTCA